MFLPYIALHKDPLPFTLNPQPLNPRTLHPIPYTIFTDGSNPEPEIPKLVLTLPLSVRPLMVSTVRLLENH